METRVNRVRFNLGQVLGALDNPEPDLPCIDIDGIGLINVRGVQLTAQVGCSTVVSISFEAEVCGTFAGKPVDDILRGNAG